MHTLAFVTIFSTAFAGSLSTLHQPVEAPVKPAAQCTGEPAKSEPAQEQAEQPAAEPAQSGEVRTADDLMRALERADEGLETLTAGILYDRVFDIAGDRQVRKGTLTYASGVNTPGEHRRFAIRFATLQIGDRIQEQDKTIIFDGEWLVEKLTQDRQFIKRRIVPPGQRFDPLKIGEGPFPIPIGQKRDDIVARYDVKLVAAEDGVIGQEPEEKPAETEQLRKFVEGAMQLLLTPKDGAEGDFREIRLWYRKASGDEPLGRWLPRMARTVNRSGDTSIVQLINVKTNTAVEQGVLDTSLPGAGWDVRVEDVPLREGK